MSTFSQITDEVSRKLSGFTLRQEKQTALSETINASALLISIASSSNISTGIIQIDDELIYVDSYNKNTGVLSIPPYGRGYNGTTAAAHTAGAKVVITPTFPNVDIKGAINDTIQSMYPDLFALTSYNFTYTPARVAYEIPNEIETIVSVSYESIGPSREWIPVRAWRIDPMANPSSFGNSSNSISIYTAIPAGRTVRIFYTKIPSVLSNSSDDFATVTGLPQSSQDVVVLGASWRLSSFIDPGRLTFASAESDQQSQVAGRTYGAGTNTSKYLFSLYQERLAQESSKLLGRFPIRVHYTR
jgi:hypothetical protein